MSDFVLYNERKAQRPNSSLSIEHYTEIPMSLNLSLCSMLHKLCLYLDPKIAIDEQSLDMLRSMLSLWDADVPLQRVYLSPNYECEFTRQAYADVLRTMGQVLEGWVGGNPVPSRVDREASEQHMLREVCVVLCDWEVWESWWWAHIKGCFPTFAKSDRLYKAYSPRKCSSAIVYDTDISLRILCSASVS